MNAWELKERSWDGGTEGDMLKGMAARFFERRKMRRRQTILSSTSISAARTEYYDLLFQELDGGSNSNSRFE